MNIETYKIDYKSCFFVFVVASPDRIEAISKIFKSMGGRISGPQSFTFPKKDSVNIETIRNSIGDMKQEECISIIDSEADDLDYRILVAQKTNVGIMLG